MARKNQQRISVTRLVTPIALAITLAACTAPTRAPESVDITLDPTLSAQNYLVKADAIEGSIQNDWLIMALKASLQENNTQQAQLLINRLEKQGLTETQQAEWQLARAQYNYILGQPEEGLKELNFPGWWNLPKEQWKDYYFTRAELFEQLEDYFSAARELTYLSDYIPLEDREEISNQIWRNLSQYSRFDIGKFSAQPDEKDLSSWLQLAVYMKTMGHNIAQLKGAIEIWLQDNPVHTAAIYMPEEILTILNLEIVQPKHTALLLPLSGKFEKQAKLVRNGFVLALMNDSDREDDAVLTVFDTNEQSGEELIQTMAEQNVDFVVGPLMKDNIEALTKAQESKEVQIPMLALNFPDQLDDSLSTCYLTLSPEQEVSQAAQHLFAQGFQYPLILAPKGSFGERVAIAFQNEWNKYSRNPAVVSYFGTKPQLQQNINNVLGVNASQNRIARMENLLETELEHQARSRRDVDAVYIIAKSSELTLIKPFIEVAINPEATPPKLFANSRSNSGGNRQFEDLSGVKFSDIPLLVESNVGLTAQMEELWPEQSNGQKRLLALGMDAYKLIGELPQMKVSPDYSVKGHTGILSIDDQCVINRQVSWTEHEALQ